MPSDAARSLPPTLTDGVVALRPWCSDDAAWYAEGSRDADVQRFTTDPPDLTAGTVEAAIAELAQHPDRFAYLVADAASGERLGTIALDRDGDVAEVSYWVSAPARGRGVGRRALRLVVDAGLQRLGVTEVRLWTHAGNTASRRVAEAAGFVRDRARDRDREVKGCIWPTVGYSRRP